jgi:methyl-galactoside transport system substrate-binding protein
MKKLRKAMVLVLCIALAVLPVMATGCTTPTSAPTQAPAVAATSTPAAPAATPAPAAKKIHVGICIYNFADTYIASVRDAMKTQLDALSDTVTYEILDGGNDQAKQTDQIDTLITKGVDVLVVNIVDISAAQSVVDKAKAANVPLIFFNREMPDSVVQSYANKCAFVGTQPEQAGIMQGDLISQIMKAHPEYDTNKDGKINYVMFKGTIGNPEAEARTKFSVDQATKDGVQLVELGTDQPCDWDTAKAQAAMATLITQYGVGGKGGIELVIANNDGMALGCIAALNAASPAYNTGSGNFIPVVGVDATADAKDNIAKGKMSGTIMQDAVGMATGIVSMIPNAAAGKSFIDGTKLQWDTTGCKVRIPYQIYNGK